MPVVLYLVKILLLAKLVQINKRLMIFKHTCNLKDRLVLQIGQATAANPKRKEALNAEVMLIEIQVGLKVVEYNLRDIQMQNSHKEQLEIDLIE